MEDLIKREKLFEHIKAVCLEGDGGALITSEDFLKMAIKGIPSAEKQGKWIMSDIQCKEDTDNGNYQYICSECGHGDIHARTQEVPYCWWCGARMGADDE